MKLCVDLCSGLGGFSSAFRDSPDWEVITVDIERKFKPTICADAGVLPLRDKIEPEIILASPPCQCFSVMSIPYYWENRKPKNAKTLQAIDLVKRIQSEIKRLNPRYHLMENPMGMLRTVIGKPPHTIRLTDFGAPWKKPTDLWGNVPFGMISEIKPWPHMPRGSKKGIQNSRYSAAERARLPIGLSRVILEAIESA